MWMCGKGLAESTVGIVGLGRIGMGVARRLKPFGVAQILYTGRSDKPYAADVDANRVDFSELLARLVTIRPWHCDHDNCIASTFKIVYFML